MVSYVFNFFRQREQPVRGHVMTRLTHSAEDVDVEPSTDSEKSAELADFQAKRCESMQEQTAKFEQEREKDQEA